ncbi:MAG: ABC transporter permease subunit [Pseudomonadota bacterium]
MLRYTLGRLLGAIPTVLLVIVLAFALVRAAPGGPFDAERVVPPATEAQLRAYYNLDAPLPEQFFDYLAGLLRGDFGPSFRYTDQTVSELIASSFPISMLLGSLALLLALLVGVPAGILAALRPNTLTDRLVMALAMSGISIPVFVFAPILVLVFAVHLNWFPAGWSSSGGISRMVLPVVALALPQIAYVARLSRASLIDVLNSDFIRTARAQGLSEASIIRYHALKPAMLPVVSYLGPAVAIVLTGSVIVEEVFGVPGIGQYFVRGALNRDYTLVLGIVIFYAVLIIVANLIVDLVYSWLDPRIRNG